MTYAPKSGRLEDGGIRFCPLFAELRPLLETLRDLRNPGIDVPNSAPVFTRWQTDAQNLRTAFQRLLIQSDLTPWPKLFHNLRASRQTELLEQFPAADVCAWIGNTQAVAMKHDAMPTTNGFMRAVCGSAGGSVSGSLQSSAEQATIHITAENSLFDDSCNSMSTESVTRSGLELIQAMRNPVWSYGNRERSALQNPVQSMRGAVMTRGFPAGMTRIRGRELIPRCGCSSKSGRSCRTPRRTGFSRWRTMLCALRLSGEAAGRFPVESDGGRGVLVVASGVTPAAAILCDIRST